MVARGGIYWIDLDERRPCVVVSSEEVLDVEVWQTHVVPLTSNVERAGMGGNVLLASGVTGLPKDSVAVPLGLELMDRALLGEMAGRLPRSWSKTSTTACAWCWGSSRASQPGRPRSQAGSS